jgi:hypothetical protein
MGEAKNRDKQAVFVVTRTKDDNLPLVVLGIPRPAFEGHLVLGKTNSFDLMAAVGLPVRIMMFGGESRSHILDMLKDTGKIDQTALDELKDYPIPETDQTIVKMRAAAKEYLSAVLDGTASTRSSRASRKSTDKFIEGLVDTILKQGDTDD